MKWRVRPPRQEHRVAVTRSRRSEPVIRTPPSVVVVGPPQVVTE